jgi:hypothetical protein
VYLTDKPLPGDLVIREEVDRSGDRPLAVFTVAHWPRTDTLAGPYQSYAYALRQARQYVAQAHARVWFVVHPSGPELRDVTDP